MNPVRRLRLLLAVVATSLVAAGSVTTTASSAAETKVVRHLGPLPIEPGQEAGVWLTNLCAEPQQVTLSGTNGNGGSITLQDVTLPPQGSSFYVYDWVISPHDQVRASFEWDGDVSNSTVDCNPIGELLNLRASLQVSSGSGNGGSITLVDNSLQKPIVGHAFGAMVPVTNGGTINVANVSRTGGIYRVAWLDAAGQRIFSESLTIDAGHTAVSTFVPGSPTDARAVVRGPKGGKFLVTVTTSEGVYEEPDPWDPTR